jgi:hypothetical protein
MCRKVPSPDLLAGLGMPNNLFQYVPDSRFQEKSIGPDFQEYSETDFLIKEQKKESQT